jgi:hypothetical protein
MTKVKEETMRPAGEQASSVTAGTRAHIPFKDLTVVEQNERRRNLKAYLAYMRDKDRELIKCRFRYYDCPGGELKFPFRKYKEDSIEKYSLIDNQVYHLPLGVVRHLNKDCFFVVHQYHTNENGVATQVIGKKIQRCEAIPLEFVDIEDLSPAGTDILTVQNLL